MDAAAATRSVHGYELSPREAGELLGCSRDTITRWADQGLLPEWRTPGGYRRYRREDVLHLVESRIA